MLVSPRWLQELCPVEADVAEVARRISLAGLEVEAMEEKGAGLSNVVIAEVRAKVKELARQGAVELPRATNPGNEIDLRGR